MSKQTYTLDVTIVKIDDDTRNRIKQNLMEQICEEMQLSLADLTITRLRIPKTIKAQIQVIKK